MKRWIWIVALLSACSPLKQLVAPPGIKAPILTPEERAAYVGRFDAETQRDHAALFGKKSSNPDLLLRYFLFQTLENDLQIAVLRGNTTIKSAAIFQYLDPDLKAKVNAQEISFADSIKIQKKRISARENTRARENFIEAVVLFLAPSELNCSPGPIVSNYALSACF